MSDLFHKFSTKIVKNFLHTAVILDDRAIFNNTLDESPTSLIIPSGMEPNDVIESQMTTSTDNKILEDETHKLDASTVINEFNQKGIICSIIKPKDRNELTGSSLENFISLIKKADIIILDWDLFHDGGEFVLELIKSNFLKKEPVEVNELRLIIIYSANNLSTIRRKLIDELSVNFEEDSYSSSEDHKFTHLTLFNKAKTLDQVDPNRVVGFANLVDKSIEEFTRVYTGIVPNCVLSAITNVRQNTHKLLNVMNSSLDPAFISHRMLLTNPDDVEHHVEELISDEIASIIRSAESGKAVSYDNIKHSPLIYDKQYLDNSIDAYIKNGIESDLSNNQKKLFKKDVKNGFTCKWSNSDNERCSKSELDFAKLTQLQTAYASISYLKFGVILQDIKSEPKISYLCIQPPCDCERLNSGKGHKFLFLKLTLITGSNSEGFDLIASDDSKYEISYNKSNRFLIEFNADSDGVVKFKSNIDNKELSDTSGMTYKFVSILKNAQTQRITNEFAASIARVGLNESEFLRRNSKRSG